MTGPEHYREAERLIDTVSPAPLSMDFRTIRAILAAAQVHATLAAAAATALCSGPGYDNPGAGATRREWLLTAGDPPVRAAIGPTR